MNEQRKKKSAFAMICLIAMLLLVSLSALPNDETQQEIEPAKTTFVLSTWSYPDSYGQGIEAIEVLGNSTGSWVIDTTVEYNSPSSVSTLEWDVGVGVRLDVYTHLNSTLVGCSSRTEGQLFQRHYVIVKDSSDTTIFSQQNFSYEYSHEDNFPLYFYQYRVTFDFLPVIGEVYTIEVMYEIYY